MAPRVLGDLVTRPRRLPADARVGPRTAAERRAGSGGIRSARTNATEASGDSTPRVRNLPFPTADMITYLIGARTPGRHLVGHLGGNGGSVISIAIGYRCQRWTCRRWGRSPDGPDGYPRQRINRVRGTAVQPAAPLTFSEGVRLRRVVLLGCCRAGCPAALSRSAPGRCSSASASSARAGSAASCPACPARDSASAARDCAPVTASSRSCRAAAACSCAARASCSAAAFASRASASRASACRRGQARLPRISLGLLGAGLKPGPGLLGRRDLRLEPGPQLGLVPLGVLAGLRHLLLRGPAHPVQLRPGRLGRLPRLAPRHRLVPLLAAPRPACCLRGPRLLLGGGLRLPRLGQPRLGLAAQPRLGQPRPRA